MHSKPCSWSQAMVATSSVAVAISTSNKPVHYSEMACAICDQAQHGTTRFASTTRVLAKRTSKYSRISHAWAFECLACTSLMAQMLSWLLMAIAAHDLLTSVMCKCKSQHADSWLCSSEEATNDCRQDCCHQDSAAAVDVPSMGQTGIAPLKGWKEVGCGGQKHPGSCK